MALGVNSRGGDMVRLVFGAGAGGAVQWLGGFLFWGTPLSAIAWAHADETRAADVQAALARNLSELGAGTYRIPWTDTANGTILLGRGPVAMIHFNPAGTAPSSGVATVAGLVLSVAMMLLVGLALFAVADRVADTARRLRVALLIGAAGVLYFTLSQAVYGFYLPKAFWLYTAVAQLVCYAAGAFVLVRWFLPAPSAAQQV